MSLALSGLGTFSKPSLSRNLALNANLSLATDEDQVTYAQEVLGFSEQTRREALLQEMVSKPESYLEKRNALLTEARYNAADTFNKLYKAYRTKDRLITGGDGKVTTLKAPAMPEASARMLALQAAQAQYEVIRAGVEVAEPSAFGNVAIELQATNNRAQNMALKEGVGRALTASAVPSVLTTRGKRAYTKRGKGKK